MRIGPTDRGGFTPLANAETERLFNELTPEQFRFYVGLRIEAQYGQCSERRDAFGRPVSLEPGEVLFGIDGAATRYGLSRDQVRRAVERFEVLGLVRRRAGVAAAIPPNLGAATPRGREAATPPTVLTFVTDREICWRAKRTATPPAEEAAPPPEPVAAPIQHRTKEPENTEKPSPSPEAPARRGTRRKTGSDPDPRHRPLQERLETVFLEVRGDRYGFQPRDARGIADLLRLSGGDVGEIERRWRAGLGEGGFRRCDTIHELAAVKWNAYAGSPRLAAQRDIRTGVAAPAPGKAFTGGERELTT